MDTQEFKDRLQGMTAEELLAFYENYVRGDFFNFTEHDKATYFLTQDEVMRRLEGRTLEEQAQLEAAKSSAGM